MGRKGGMMGPGSFNGGKEGRREKRTISCYAARQCYVLGLGQCRPFNNVKYVGKGEEGPSVEEGGSEDNLLQHCRPISP